MESTAFALESSRDTKAGLAGGYASQTILNDWIESLQASLQRLIALIVQPITATLTLMSKEAIQAVIQELETLPDADQQVLLTFLARLKQSRQKTNGLVSEYQSALATTGGLLVFTGQLEQPETDWVRAVREEHDESVTQAALGRTVRP